MNSIAKRIKRFATCCGILMVLAASAGLASNTAFAAGIKPINKMKLVYPRRALQRGIEGYVQLEFTVTAEGKVSDVVITDSNPSKIFDKAAIKAVKKLKYEPQSADVPGVPLKVTFKLS